MNAKRILAVMLALVVAGVGWNQWRLQQMFNRLNAATNAAIADGQADGPGSAAARLRQAEARFDEARAQWQIADQKLAAANAQVTQLAARLRKMEAPPQRGRFPGGLAPLDELSDDATRLLNGVKRGWGPEQVVGEPDTFQAGDISTAWAPREPDGGEEWLKLEYDKAVDIAEVRVRETYNPGAISKVTAFLANGTEITLWEGVEPKAPAPVEMSFQIPESVNARSIKVYLDTRRVPGWNEIDAVELIGRDGSHQWAKQASASSTYAEPSVNRNRLTERLP